MASSSSPSPSSSNMTQAPSSTTPSPNRVLKRKVATDKDIFKPNKRPQYSQTNKSTFGLEYQEEQRKVQDELPMRSDMLEGVIVPTRRLPSGVDAPFSKKFQQGDPTAIYRWAAQHGNSCRVQRDQHLTREDRDKATATFPKQEARKEEERKAKATAAAEFVERVEDYIQCTRRYIDKNEKNKYADKEELQGTKFMHRCWKELAYTARFQPTPVEHQDLQKWHDEFSEYWHKIWNKEMGAYLVPRWSKDQTRGRLVMEWEYLKN